MSSQPEPAPNRRLLNHWNACRHGWDRFQASSRRTAERIARAGGDDLGEDSDGNARAGRDGRPT